MVVEIANRMADAVLQERPSLLMWFDQAFISLGDSK